MSDFDDDKKQAPEVKLFHNFVKKIHSYHSPDGFVSLLLGLPSEHTSLTRHCETCGNNAQDLLPSKPPLHSINVFFIFYILVYCI